MYLLELGTYTYRFIQDHISTINLDIIEDKYYWKLLSEDVPLFNKLTNDINMKILKYINYEMWYSDIYYNWK